MINVIPIYKEIKARDPEAVYNAVRGENTYLLESAEGGEKVARYSFIGFEPAAKLAIKDGKVRFEVFDCELKKLKIKGKDPLEIMKNLISQFKLSRAHDALSARTRFFGGFVGYFSYDLVRYFYNLKGKTRDDFKEPDCEFVLTKNNIIFDHKKKRAYLISHQFVSLSSLRDKPSPVPEGQSLSCP